MTTTISKKFNSYLLGGIINLTMPCYSTLNHVKQQCISTVSQSWHINGEPNVVLLEDVRVNSTNSSVQCFSAVFVSLYDINSVKAKHSVFCFIMRYNFSSAMQIYVSYIHIHIHVFILHGCITKSQYNQFPVGLIAQLVEPCTGIAEVMGSNPVQA